MAMNMLLDQVKNAVLNHADQHNAQTAPQGGAFDPSQLLGTIEGLFGQHQAAQTQPQGMDPYGGLPNEGGQFPNVKSSNEDPYGDPADENAGQFRNVKSSNEDPYGDPG